MSHVTHVNESHHTYQWVTSHMSMSHITHINESRHTCQWVIHTYQWVTSHISISHRTHINESYLALCLGFQPRARRKQHAPNIWMRHVPHINKSRHTYQRVIPGVVPRLPTARPPRATFSKYINASCHMYEWVISHISMSHITHINEPRNTYQ